MNASKAPSCDSFHQPSVTAFGPWPATRTPKLLRRVTSTEAAPCFEDLTLASIKMSGIMTHPPSRKAFSLRSADFGPFRRPRRPAVTPYTRAQTPSAMIESIRISLVPRDRSLLRVIPVILGVPTGGPHGDTHLYEMGKSFLRVDPGTTRKGTGYRHQIPLDAWTAPRTASPTVETPAKSPRIGPNQTQAGGSAPSPLVRISGSIPAFQTTRNQI
jgi:hypothetical protein